MASVDSLVSGGGVVCALSRDIPSCWGRNRPRLLWSVNETELSSPQTLGSLAGSKALAFGARAGCRVDRDGVLSCFGGGGEKPAPPTKVTVDAALALDLPGFLSLGSRRGCVVHADTGVSCFDLKPSLDTEQGFSFASKRIRGVRSLTSIEVGGKLACGLDGKGKVVCFDEEDRQIEVSGTEDLVALAVGESTACGRTKNGEVRCWGENALGEAGLGNFEPVLGATPVKGLREIVAIDTAGRHFCALEKEGDLWCWGADNAGQSGGGTEMSFDEPVLLEL